MTSEPAIQELRKAVVALDPEMAEKACTEILKAGIDPQRALADGAVEGLKEVGTLYENQTYALPELMLSMAVMDSVREVLEPEILKANKSVERKGSILIGTVAHDIHDIGKKIVAAMLRSAGWEVFDIGNNVSPSTFVEEAEKINPDIIGMSALLTTTIPYADTTAQALRNAEVRGKVIFGGAPVTKSYAASIGVSYAENAGEACRVCADLIGEETE